MIETLQIDVMLPGADVAPSYFYRAYGLTICSEIELPELETADAAVADVSIRLRSINRPKPVGAGSTAFDLGAATEQYLAWESVGAFLIRDANQIDVEPAPGVDQRLIAFPLLGPVLALLLHQRGLLVLHASAVAARGNGIVFLGDKGAGKSTTASAMLAAGYDLLTDDLVAIDFSEVEGPRIAPGFPQLKLSREAATSIDVGSAIVRPQVHPGIDKLQHRLKAGFARDAVAPTRLYVLRRASMLAVRQLPPSEALAAILRFSYVVRFGSAALAGEAAAHHLRQCARLAEKAGVFQLDVPHDLQGLGAAVALVEQDMAPAVPGN